MSESMRMLIAAYVLGALVCWPINVGMFFHESQALWLDDSRDYIRALAPKHAQSHLGSAVALGFLYSLTWPVATPMAYCLTGFAEHGVFSQK